MFDQIRNIHAKSYQENRTLSFEENQIISQLTQESIIGYNKAFKDSLKISDQTIRLGVYGIIVHKDEVLMVKTQSGSKSIYNFPGGGVDEDESLAQALIRECQEEINTVVQVKDCLYTAKSLYKHEDFPSFYMFNIYYDIEVKDKEEFYQKKLAEDNKWFPINDLPRDEMLPIDIEFVESYFNICNS